jgi:hypothetical protein
MTVHLFEIFSGTADGGALWIESAVGLDTATQRMNALAGTRPGKYFVFDGRTNQIVAKTNTTDVPPLKRKAASIN